MRPARYDRSAELDKHQTSKPVIVVVVSSIPTGGTFIFYRNFLKPLNVNSVQKYQKYQTALFKKTSNELLKQQ